MHTPVNHPLPTHLSTNLIETRTDLPANPEPGNYVVVDVMFFSTTVVELLANGATHVHVTEERGEEFAYREHNPRAKLGGSRTSHYTPTEGYDFFNSPSYVQSVDVEGRSVSMTSKNGGRAVTDLRDAGGPDVDVYVGGTTNAAALGHWLREDDRPTYLVSAGSKGEPAIEDHLGAVLVSRHLHGVPVSDVETELYARLLDVAKGVDYVNEHETRRRDVREFVAAFDSRTVVPRVDGDRLVDATRTGRDAPAGANATR